MMASKTSCWFLKCVLLTLGFQRHARGGNYSGAEQRTLDLQLPLQTEHQLSFDLLPRGLPRKTVSGKR